MANTYIRKAFSTTGTSRQKFTLSMWIKRGSGLGAEQMLCECYSGSTAKDEIWLQSNDTLNFVKTDGGGLATTTSAKFRDTFGWYHIVISADTTQGSNADRIKIYVNGVQQSLAQQDTITQNSNFQFGASGAELTFGVKNNLSWYFNGSMSHIHVIDGTAYPASTFGSTDATTGEWKAKTSPSVTYGTNGFFILKDGNGITDQSGEGNNFTLGGGTLTDLKDNPDNVFATANPLTNLNGSATYSEGNLKVSGGSAANNVWQTTLGVSSGKWYWELKNLISNNDLSLLFYDQSIISGSHPGYGFVCSSTKKIINGSVIGSAIGSAAQNDIWSVALDLDNGKMFIARNGTYLESGNPSTGANPFIQTSDGLPSEGVFGGHVYNGSVELNFGNGYFGTTAITTNSGNGYAGAEGASKFNYTVPTGYSALNTKGLNE